MSNDRTQVEKDMNLFLSICDDINEQTFENNEEKGEGFEPPDVYLSDSKIGIEIVSFVRADWRAREAEVENIVDRARQIYSEYSDIPLMVTLHWSDSRPHAKQRQELIKSIAEIVKDNIPQDSKEVVLSWEQLRNSSLENMVHYIGILKSNSSIGNHWTPIDAQWVAGTSEEFYKLIRKKENKLSSWIDREYTQKWLLIVARGDGLSGIVDVSLLDFSTLITDFDSVYFLNRLGNICKRLK